VSELAYVLLALGAVLAPLALAGWLLRERPRRDRQRDADAAKRRSRPASE
jgi:hypothetical protein